jgi:hypothetical protein
MRRVSTYRPVQFRGATSDHDIDFVIDVGKVSHVFAHSIISEVSVALAFKENNLDLSTALAAASPDARTAFSIADGWLRRFRDQFSMTCSLTPPLQVTSFGGGAAEKWSRPALALVDVPAFWNGSFRPLAIDPQGLSGINPIGAWSLNLSRNLRNADGGNAPISVLSAAGGNSTPLQIADLVVSLKLQNWK